MRPGLLVGAVGMSLLMAAAACGSSSSHASSSGSTKGAQTIEIGVNQPLSGVGAAYGEAEVAGARYAAEVANRDHVLGPNVTIKLDVRDDQYTQQQAVINANAMLASHDVAVFGPIETASAQATAAQLGKKILNVLTEADGVPLNASDPDVYNLTPTGDSTFAGLAKYLKSKGATTLAFVHDPSSANEAPLMKEVTPILAASGIRVSDEVAVDLTQTQFAASMSKLAQEDPSVIYLLANGQAPVMLRELRGDGYKGIVAAYSAPPSVFAPAGSAANGLVQPVFFTPLKPVNAEASQFVTGFTAANHSAPTNYSAEAYDAIMFTIAAVKGASSDNRSAITASAGRVAAAGFTGVEGHYTFNNTAYAKRRADLPSQILIYGANGQPASVAPEG